MSSSHLLSSSSSSSSFNGTPHRSLERKPAEAPWRPRPSQVRQKFQAVQSKSPTVSVLRLLLFHTHHIQHGSAVYCKSRSGVKYKWQFFEPPCSGDQSRDQLKTSQNWLPRIGQPMCQMPWFYPLRVEPWHKVQVLQTQCTSYFIWTHRPIGYYNDR